MATRQIDRRPKPQRQPTPEPAAITAAPVGVRGSGSIAISGLVHADVDHSAKPSGLGSIRLGVDRHPGRLGPLRKAAAGARNAPRAARSGDGEPIRRATKTIPYTVKKKSRSLELDTDKPTEFKTAILEFKRGGSDSSRDTMIYEVMKWLDGLLASPEHKHSSVTLNDLRAYCADIYMTEQADLPASAPPKGEVTEAAPEAKPKKITFKQLKDPVNLDVLADRWGLPRDDPRFLAAISSPGSYTFINGLSPDNREILTGPSLAGDRVHAAIALIRQPPAQKGVAIGHLVRCLDHAKMTTDDIKKVRERWHKDLDKLSSLHEGTYRERVEAALASAKTFYYFDSLSEDERLYVSNNKFRMLQPPDATAVAKLKASDLTTAKKERKTRNRQVQGALSADRVRKNLTTWEALEASFLAEVRGQVAGTGVDGGEWATDVDSLLAEGRKKVEGGTGVDKAEATLRNDTRTALKRRYLGSISAQHFPNLLVTPEFRNEVISNPDLDIGAIRGELERAWNSQRGPTDRDTWIAWMNLRLAENGEFNPLAPVGDYTVHFSTKAVSITVPRVDSGTDARALVSHMIRSRGTERFDQIHVTLETGVQRGAGGYQQPHKYANGEYDFAFQDPAETGPWFNRWDRLPWIGERPVATTPAATQAAQAEMDAKAAVRAALDQAYARMVTELERRAAYILTHGRGNPGT